VLFGEKSAVVYLTLGLVCAFGTFSLLEGLDHGPIISADWTSPTRATLQPLALFFIALTCSAREQRRLTLLEKICSLVVVLTTVIAAALIIGGDLSSGNSASYSWITRCNLMAYPAVLIMLVLFLLPSSVTPPKSTARPPG
jgi:hypothetical protein